MQLNTARLLDWVGRVVGISGNKVEVHESTASTGFLTGDGNWEPDCEFPEDRTK